MSSKKEEHKVVRLVKEEVTEILKNHPKLFYFVEGLSREELQERFEGLIRDLANGSPFEVPADFVYRVKREVSVREWKSLETLLKEWDAVSDGSRTSPLGKPSLRQLASSVIWQTLVLTECSKRT